MIIPTDRKELLTIWHAATLSPNRHLRSKFLTKRDLAVIDLASICDYILGHTLPLPVLAGLLLGMVKVAHHQSRFIYVDVLHLWVRIQRDMTTMHAMVDMPVTEASMRMITLKELPALHFGPEFDLADPLAGVSTGIDEHSFSTPSLAPQDGYHTDRSDDIPAASSEANLIGEQPLDGIDNNIIWSNDDFDFNDFNQSSGQQIPQLLPTQRELATPEYSRIRHTTISDEDPDTDEEYHARHRRRHRQWDRHRRGSRYVDPDALTTVPARFYSRTDELINRIHASSPSPSKKNDIVLFQKDRLLTPFIAVAGMAMPHPVFWKHNYRLHRFNHTALVAGESQQVESVRRGMSDTSSSDPSGIMPYIADMVEAPWPHLPRSTNALHRDSSASSGQWTDMDDPGFYDLDNMSDIGEGSFELLNHDDGSDQNNDGGDEGIRFLRHARLFASQDDASVDFDYLFTDPRTRSKIARGFYEVLCLASRNLLYPNQSEPYGVILLKLLSSAAV